MIQGGDISLGQANQQRQQQQQEQQHQPLPFDIPKGGTSIHHPSALNQEIHLPALRHSTRGVLSMAARPLKDPTAPGSQNATGNTINGSQFFVTFAPAPHLDGASTVFGKVLNVNPQDLGGDVLTRLERAEVKVDKKGRVVQGGSGLELGIKSVTIHANPFAK